MYKRILVATDGTALSKKAIAAALDLAELCGAELIALNVVPRYPMSYFEGGASVPASEVARVEKIWAASAQLLVNVVCEEAHDRGLKARAVTLGSDLVAETIVKATRKYRCDLVVMASHGRKGLQRLLLGSETQHVLTHSTVPVLVLR